MTEIVKTGSSVYSKHCCCGCKKNETGFLKGFFSENCYWKLNVKNTVIQVTMRRKCLVGETGSPREILPHLDYVGKCRGMKKKKGTGLRFYICVMFLVLVMLFLSNIIHISSLSISYSFFFILLVFLPPNTGGFTHVYLAYCLS